MSKSPFNNSAGKVNKSGDTMTGTLVMSGAAINEAAFATVASAATCDIGAAASNNVAISGTTTITSFGTANAGITRRCRATGAFLITYNGTSLITANGKNIVTKADDCFTMTSLGSGNWIMTSFKPADGRILANAINNQTGTTYTFALTDLGNDVTALNASDSTYTLPQTSSVAFPIGSKIKLINLGTGTVTLVKQGAETLLGNTELDQYATAYIEKIDSSTWQVSGGTSVNLWQETLTVETVGNVTYNVIKLPFTGILTSISSICRSGSCTATTSIAGTPVTATANSVSTSDNTQAVTAANTFVDGNYLTTAITSNSSCLDMCITYRGTYRQNI